MTQVIFHKNFNSFRKQQIYLFSWSIWLLFKWWWNLFTSKTVHFFPKYWQQGVFQKHLWALNFHLWIKSTIFNVWISYFVWNFKGTLWNSTQNTLPIHGKIWCSYNIEIFRALGFKSSYESLNPPITQLFAGFTSFNWGLLTLYGDIVRNQHWLRWWLATCSASSHYLNQHRYTVFGPLRGNISET